MRELDLKKSPSIAETIDWARALLLLDAKDLDAKTPSARTMSVDRQAPHRHRIVAARVGVRLEGAPMPPSARRAPC